jgi:hypothetical protein
VDYAPDSGAAVGLIGLIVAIYVIVLIVVAAGAYVLTAVSLMQLFKKVGIEPWIAWVPYYNQWKLLELGGQPGWMVLIALLPVGNIVTLVFLIFGEHRIGIAFGKDASWTVLAVFLPWLWALLLGRSTEVYDPSRLAYFGYPPPNAGYGSVPRQPGQGFGI